MAKGRIIVDEQLVIDFDTKKMWNIKNPNEYESLENLSFLLLEYLYENSGRYCTNGQIIENVWKEEYYEVSDERVKKTIFTTRKHIEVLTSKEFAKHFIKTKKQFGYIIDKNEIKIRRLDNNTEESITDTNNTIISSTSDQNDEQNNTSTHTKSKTIDSLKKLLKKPTSIVYIILIVILLVFIIRLLMYDNYMKKGDSYLSSLNYKEGVEYFQKAASCSLNTSQYVQAICREADCYSTEVSISTDINDNKSKLLLKEAIETYSKIVNNPKYEDTEYYYDALAGITMCYILQNHSINDNNWKNYIETLEDYFDKLIKKDITYDVISQSARISKALALYYKSIAKISNPLEVTDDNNASEKHMYYDSMYAFYNNLTNQVRNTTDENERVYNGITAAINLLDNYNFSWDKDHARLTRLINTLNKNLTYVCDSNSNITPENVFLSKFTLGKAYFTMLLSTEGETKEEYRIKAYDIFSNLLSTPYNIAGKHYPSIGYYCARTCVCTDEVLSKILSNYKTYFDSVDISKDPNAYARVANGALSTFAFISLAYSNHYDFDVYALELLNKILEYEVYFDEYNSTSIHNYYNYFTHNGGDITLVEMMYSFLK